MLLHASDLAMGWPSDGFAQIKPAEIELYVHSCCVI